MTSRIISLPLVLSILLLSSCGNDRTKKDIVTTDIPAPETLYYGVVNTHPHSTEAFTEGLLFHQGKLYESTGAPSDCAICESWVAQLDLTSGAVDKKVQLGKKYFGEGIVFLNNKLYQLTYQTKIGFIYDAETFAPRGEFKFPSKEGWGMTTDGTSLIMSDGTSTLTYLDPETFQTTKSISVKDNNGAVDNLNELEFIKGFIYANVYTTNTIVKIDPATGYVTGKLDLTSLASDAASKNADALELNGIAFHADSGTVFVTGKFWPSIFEIKFKL